MTRRTIALFCVLLCLMGMGGCKKEIANQPTGKLVGISYKRTVGSIYGEDKFIRLRTDEIEYAECFSEALLEYIVVESLPLDGEIWKVGHDLVMAAYPYLSEITEPTTVERLKDRFLEAQVLDGGDETLLTLVWETEEGSVTKDYGIGYSEETTQLEDWLMDLILSVVLGEGAA